MENGELVAKPTGDMSGWLSPEGGFHYVPYGSHSYVAETVFGLQDYELMRGGWIHISGTYLYHRLPPTSAQVEVLLDIKRWYTVNEHRLLDYFKDSLYALMGWDSEKEIG